MKKLLLIPILLFCVTAFGQFTKPELYTNINTNIRLKTYSPTRMASLLDSLVATMGSGSGMVYPGAGIPLSTGSAWGTSITDNSANWNAAFSRTYSNGLTLSSGDVKVGGTLLDDTFINSGAYIFRVFNTDNIIDISAAGIELASTTGLIKINLGSDATGDTYYRNSGGYFTRLAAGTNGHVLTLSGGLPSWAAPSGGGSWGSITGTLSSQTDLQTVLDDKFSLTNGGTLAGASVLLDGDGNTFTINNVDAFTLGATSSLDFDAPAFTFSNGPVSFEAGTTSYSSLKIPHGVAPTSPVDGDFWSTTSGFFGRVNGSTVSFGGGGSLSGLTAATGSNTINNAANAQEWQWNTLGAGTGLLLSSSSTAAASNTNTLFRVNQTGANATSTQTTYSGYFSNTKTGTSSTNVGLHAAASGGTTNYAGTFDGIIGQYDGAGANFNYMQVVGTTWRLRAAASLNLYVGSNILMTAAARKITLGYSAGSGSGETQSLETLSGAWTSIPTTTELTDIIFNSNSATWTWDAGTTTTQRFNWFKGHTVNGGTLTTAYQLYVDAPIVGTGTITNNYAAGFGGNIIATGNATINGSVTVGSSYTTQGQIIQNVGLTGSDVYRRKVEWTPVTASGSSGNFDFNIFNTDVIQNSTCTVTITVTGVNSSGVKSYAKEMKATFRKPGTSDPVQVGSTTDIYEHSNDLTTPTSSVSASTDYCRVNYDSGTGAPTLQWTVFIETKYSTN